MDWNFGFSAKYYGAIIDPVTWRDVSTFELIDGKISRGESALIESASVTTSEFDNEREYWIRLWLVARQAESSEHVPLFTGLTQTPNIDISGNIKRNTLECYSVLKPAEDIYLPRGWYAPAGISGAKQVANLLSVTPAPKIVTEDAPVLSQYIIAEDDETNLTMAEKILNVIGWHIRISGDGSIYICPKDADAVARFDPQDNDSIEPKLEISSDFYECPNVFRAVSDDLTAIARDDSESSMLSTVNRGREIWSQETSCDLNDGESIEQYAMRRLKEEQSYAYSISYDRRFRPDVTIGDVIRMDYPAQGIQGDWQIESQDITLGSGCKTSEKAKRI